MSNKIIKSDGNMDKDRNELSETITIKECRTLRAVMNDLTAAPVLTRQEYLRFMVEIGHVLQRLEQENGMVRVEEPKG